jgi:hypothetical protein
MHAITPLAPEKPRALKPGQRPVSRFMRKAQFGRERLPGAPEATRAVRLGGQRVQHVEQAVGGVRQGEALGAGPFRHETGREVSRDAPGELRFGFGRTAQLGSGVDRYQARHRSHGIAVMVTLEKARLGKGLARACSVEDEAAPLGRHTNKLQDAFAHEDEPESRIALAEQSLAAFEAAIAARRKDL